MLLDQDDTQETCEGRGEPVEAPIECTDCGGLYCVLCLDGHSCEQIEEE